MFSETSGEIKTGRISLFLLYTRSQRVSLYLLSLGVGAVLVLTGMAVLYRPNKQNNDTYYRYHTDKHPPHAPSGVVEPSDGYGCTGNHRSQTIETDEHRLFGFGKDTRADIDCGKHKNDDYTEQREHPILCA
ncbi:uncharacterized protein METZ01_LOCUS502570, partial [marine metagenome]